MTEARTVHTARAGLAGGLLALVLVSTAVTGWLSLVGVVTLACIPLGASIMCWFDSGEAVSQAGLTVVLSLAIVALTSAIMIWIDGWQPAVLLILNAFAMASCVLRIRWVRR